MAVYTNVHEVLNLKSSEKGHKKNDKTVETTSFDDKDKYVSKSLQKPQEQESSEQQDRHLIKLRNKTFLSVNEVNNH